MIFKIILDTNFYFSAIGFDNLLYKLLLYLVKNHETFKQYNSPATLQELTSKLHSEKFDIKTKNQISRSEKENFLTLIGNFSIQIETQIKITICRDPKDNMFLELAEEINADYIITGDKDLLELSQYKTTKILKPSEFINELQLDL